MCRRRGFPVLDASARKWYNRSISVLKPYNVLVAHRLGGGDHVESGLTQEGVAGIRWMS